MLRKLTTLAVVLGVFLTLSIVPSASQAQNVRNDLVGVTVSPVIDEFTINPGATTKRIFKLSNPVRNTITLYPVAINFTTDNLTGQPTFYTLKQRQSQYSISDWISFAQKSVTIAPDQSAEFAATFVAPANAEPGGHYGAVLFSTQPPPTDPNANQVSVVGLIGSLVLATVPGAIVQNTILEKFSAPTILIRPPANFSLLFQNLGNVHSAPTGEIRIKNWSGATTAQLTVNDGKGNVLPASERLFGVTWPFRWQAIGQYTATATVTYGSPEKILTDTRTFIILPIWFFVLVGLIILLIAWWLIKRRRRSRQVPAFNAAPNTSSRPARPPLVMR